MDQYIPLTERQRAALWLRAQGLTEASVGRRLEPPITAAGVESLIKKAVVRLEARSLTNAIFIALNTGVIGPYLDCGTRKAYLRHLRREEPSCVACRRANSERVLSQRHDREEQAVQAPPVIATPYLTDRQTDALHAMQEGASSAVEVARKIGVSDNTARKLINIIMSKFSIDNIAYARPVSYKAAVQKGLELGYLTPDRPGERPLFSPVQMRVLLAAQDDVPLPVIGARTGLGKRAVTTRLSEVYEILGIEPETAPPGDNTVSRNRRARALNRARDLGYIG